ncbi:MAG: ABC transporter permease [Desulfovibrionaceae bacterium]
MHVASSSPSTPGSGAAVTLRDAGNGGVLVLSGRLDSEGVARVWDEAHRLARGVSGALEVECGEVTAMDGAGFALLVALGVLRGCAGGCIPVRGLAPEYRAMLERFDPASFVAPPQGAKPHPPLAEEVGLKAAHAWRDLKETVSFIGECTLAMAVALRHPGQVRGKDLVRTMETAGANGLPIVVLIGFLMGLITAFQSAVPLQRFGAELFVANLLGISMMRELGPLVTAILLAGRSGSAFAAEIGTMTVNEEVNALATMGLDPLRFLAVPRIFGAMAVMPLLVIFFNLFALVGGALVITSFGYPLVTYIQKVHGSIQLGDMMGGLFKAMVFSLIVSGVGCRRGLTTQTGASAVGDSTTSAVVTSLILIAVTDGLFAVLFYTLGI